MMTKDEMRIAIAEKCGWKWNGAAELPRLGYWENGIIGTEGYKRTAWVAPKNTELLPNYPEDLNAAQEACRFAAKGGWRLVANMGLDGTWECFFTESGEIYSLPREGDHYGAADSLALAISEAFCRVFWPERFE